MSQDWYIFKGRDPNQTAESYQPRPEAIAALPDPPRWRDFSKQPEADSKQQATKKQRRGATFYPSEAEIEMVNAALYLRRPLLVTGKPGTGKTSLAYAVAYELDLGEVLYWPITTRTTLKDGLYNYDAIGRLQDFQLSKEQDIPKEEILGRIGKYIRLGPLGTAFLKSDKPRVLLIDEIDKSDIDLPNDLLHIFEEGEFSIPELERIAEEQPVVTVQTAYRDKPEAIDQATVPIEGGRVSCQQFPFVILTSNAEREFPPAFLRRCLRLDIQQPSEERLRQIVATQLDEALAKQAEGLIDEFHKKRESGSGDRATDQLLNAVYLITQQKAPDRLIDKLFRPLDK
ncbi:MAG: MoxR family ATPase [Cyanobacteria bacterium RU_5_0]|nr:MoxR family ATPase [Cyanobacteria bacterium RU_5_0]